MQRFITDERTGIQYELIGDYYYPCLTIENEEPPTLTKYGRMRERYLREHRKILYINLLTSGKLYEHLADIDTSACDMAEYLIKEMARKQGVTEELKGKDMITQPKTPKSIRVITMPDFLAEEFREYCSHLYGIMKKERLFRFTKSHMEHCMATGIERSGVKRIRLHDLRHSHASMLVDMGVAPLEIAERLGHEKVETTLNTYSHLYPSTQSKLAGLLDKKHEEEEE